MTAQLVKKLRAAKPQDRSDFNRMGLRLTYLKSGVFRDGYKVTRCDAVVKFPKGDEGKEHTRAEVARIRRLRNSPVLRPYLPEILYYDSRAGIVVMRYYPKFRSFETQVDTMCNMVERLIRAATGCRVSDLHSENIHDHDGDAVIIDLGY